MWPSMVTHTWNLCSAFNPSKCTHTVVNIHLEQWAANAAAPGEQLGVWCLAQGSHLSRGIEGGESAAYFVLELILFVKLVRFPEATTVWSEVLSLPIEFNETNGHIANDAFGKRIILY